MGDSPHSQRTAPEADFRWSVCRRPVGTSTGGQLARAWTALSCERPQTASPGCVRPPAVPRGPIAWATGALACSGLVVKGNVEGHVDSVLRAGLPLFAVTSPLPVRSGRGAGKTVILPRLIGQTGYQP